MKRWVVLILLLIGLWGNAPPAFAQENQPQQTPQMDTSQMDRFWSDLVSQYGGYLPDHAPSMSDVIGQGQFSLQGILQGLGRFLFHELYSNFQLLGTLVMIGVLAAVLQNLQTAFERQTVSTVSFAVTQMVLFVIAINSLYQAIGYARQAVQTMTDFMMAAIPLVMTLLASTGGLASMAMLHPTIVLTVTMVGKVVNNVVLPMILVSAVLQMVSTLTDRYKVTQLAGLLRTVSLGILGVMFTVFIGVMSIKGALGGITDGVTYRAAKFVSSNFIPVVGKLFSDAAETVVGTSMVVKNAAGVAGLVILLLISVFPAIKIISLSIIYHVSSALMQPLGNSPLTGYLSMIGKTMTAVFAAMATVALMFFVSITVIIAAGNVAMMVR